MKMLTSSFAKEFLGVRYERALKSIMISAVIFFGVSGCGYKLDIAPFILYLFGVVFTASVMWQSLNSKDAEERFKNIVMMPFESSALIASYVGSLGVHTICTKTLPLMALLIALGKFEVAEIVTAAAAAVGGVLLSAAIYLIKGHASKPAGYVFYDLAVLAGKSSGVVKSRRHGLVWTYLFRYLMTHKNYLVKSLFLCGIAILFPYMASTMGEELPDKNMFLYMGFGIACVNTPLCVLISCDHDLDRSLHSMPGCGLKFFVPYAGFLFMSLCPAYACLLTSWHFLIGGIGIVHIIMAVCLAFLSAVMSAAMEYFFPILNWKTESDLMHNPRKYIVPAITLLLACLIGTLVM